MHDETVDKNTFKNLQLIKTKNMNVDFYLAGGTACALHFGHRISYDLDFFSNVKFDGSHIEMNLKELGKVKTIFRNDHSFIGSLNDTKISFIFLEPPLIRKTHKWEEIDIASKEDLVAMKVEAIAGRGKKRDFIDLHMLMKDRGYSLHDVFLLYREKYNKYNYNPIHIQKSLKYFDDADKDPSPEMLIKLEWVDVKRFFHNQKLTLDNIQDREGPDHGHENDGPDFGMSMQ